MKLSAKSRYGLRAMYVLAGAYPGRVSATELERGINVSSKYIEKIMRALGGAGLVGAERGASGGYYLAARPEEITVGSVVRALEDEMEFVSCLSAGNACSCPAKTVWKKLYDGINGVLDSITLDTLFCGDEGECDCGSPGCSSEKGTQYGCSSDKTTSCGCSSEKGSSCGCSSEKGGQKRPKTDK